MTYLEPVTLYSPQLHNCAYEYVNLRYCSSKVLDVFTSLWKFFAHLLIEARGRNVATINFLVCEKINLPRRANCLALSAKEDAR